MVTLGILEQVPQSSSQSAPTVRWPAFSSFHLTNLCSLQHSPPGLGLCGNGAGMAGNWFKVLKNVHWINKKVQQGTEKCF